MKINTILLFMGILAIGYCDGARHRRLFRSKRAESDYILRSCVATAQLTRKHRTHDAGQLDGEEIGASKFPSASLTFNNVKSKSPYTNKYIRNNLRPRPRPKGRQIMENSTTDTPLATVDVQALRRNTPKLFRKKDSLPALDRNGSARSLHTDTPIYVVQAVNQS